MNETVTQEQFVNYYLNFNITGLVGARVRNISILMANKRVLS